MSNSGPSSKAKKAAAALLVAPQSKQKKRKKKTEYQKDPNWRKSSNLKRSASKADLCSISTLIGISTAPANRAKFVTERTTDLENSSSKNDESFEFQSPQKGVKSQALYIKSTEEKLALSRTISTHIGKVSYYQSEDKVNRVRIDIPEKIENLDKILDDKNLPKSDSLSIVDAKITIASLGAIEAIKRKQGSGSKRQPTNRVVTKVPANEVAKCIGLDGEDWQWWHLIGHALYGDAAQNFDNFVLGKKHGNAIMNDIAESLVKSILKDMPNSSALYLSAHVSFVKGFERARLANRVTWVLKDGAGDSYTKIVKFDFDPLAIETLSVSEIDNFKELLPKLFHEGPKSVKLITPTRPLKPLDMQSPSPDMVKSKSVLTGQQPLPLLFSNPKVSSELPKLIVSTQDAASDKKQKYKK